LHFPYDPAVADLFLPLKIALGVMFGLLLVDFINDMIDPDEPDGYT